MRRIPQSEGGQGDNSLHEKLSSSCNELQRILNNRDGGRSWSRNRLPCIARRAHTDQADAPGPPCRKKSQEFGVSTIHVFSCHLTGEAAVRRNSATGDISRHKAWW